MNEDNYLKNDLDANKRVYGVWNLIPSQHTTEIIASTGIDFQIFDMEHGVFSIQNVLECTQSISQYRCSPIVRIPFIEQTLIQRVLDCGVHGLIIPQIKNKDDAIRIVEYSRYSPSGKRGFNPFTRAGEYWGNGESKKNINGYHINIGIIENNQALENIDSILSVEGIDVWYIGIYDLSCTIGLKGQLNHPKVIDLYNFCEKKINEYGKKSGKMIDSHIEDTGNNTDFLVLKPDTYQLYSSIKEKIPYKGN
jgi:4-hydroxy-2-oxoheptanedioate aldolase